MEEADNKEAGGKGVSGKEVSGSDAENKNTKNAGAASQASDEAPNKVEEPAAKPTSLKGGRSLRKLRDRVEQVAQELIRLREENTSLQQRISELEAMPAGNGEESGALMFDSDPETLKRKVEGFIQSIDNYLENNEPAK